jgi:hypothetical protein
MVVMEKWRSWACISYYQPNNAISIPSATKVVIEFFPTKANIIRDDWRSSCEFINFHEQDMNL